MSAKVETVLLIGGPLDGKTLSVSTPLQAKLNVSMTTGRESPLMLPVAQQVEQKIVTYQLEIIPDKARKAEYPVYVFPGTSTLARLLGCYALLGSVVHNFVGD